MSNLSAKEKAKELVEKYLDIVGRHYADCIYYAKQCALIAVDEIIKELKKNWFSGKRVFLEQYWHEVKTEIDKL